MLMKDQRGHCTLSGSQEVRHEIGWIWMLEERQMMLLCGVLAPQGEHRAQDSTKAEKDTILSWTPVNKGLATVKPTRDLRRNRHSR